MLPNEAIGVPFLPIGSALLGIQTFWVEIKAVLLCEHEHNTTHQQRRSKHEQEDRKQTERQ